METEELIRHLANDARPVRTLPSPQNRTLTWLSLSMPYVALVLLVVLVVSPRADLIEKLSDLRFPIEQSAALATGIAAADTAFATVIPGYRRKVLLLPALPLAIWLGSLAQGSVQTWLRLGPEGLSLQPEWLCFPAIVLVGSVPAIALAAMLRRGAPLTPCTTVAFGGLAAAGLGNFGLRLFHPQDASLMVLVEPESGLLLHDAALPWHRASCELASDVSAVAAGGQPAVPLGRPAGGELLGAKIRRTVSRLQSHRASLALTKCRRTQLKPIVFCHVFSEESDGDHGRHALIASWHKAASPQRVPSRESRRATGFACGPAKAQLTSCASLSHVRQPANRRLFGRPVA